MDDPDWYAAWRHDAVHQLQEKNALLNHEYRTGEWSRYDYDLDNRKLIFSDGGQPKVIAEIQVVGTTSLNAGNWLWAWANSHWPLDCIEDAKQVCRFGEEHGISELKSDYVKDDDLNALGWELTAVAARVCGAIGAYRPKRDEGGALFLLYRDMHWAS